MSHSNLIYCDIFVTSRDALVSQTRIIFRQIYIQNLFKGKCDIYKIERVTPMCQCVGRSDVSVTVSPRLICPPLPHSVSQQAIMTHSSLTLAASSEKLSTKTEDIPVLLGWRQVHKFQEEIKCKNQAVFEIVVIFACILILSASLVQAKPAGPK